MSYNEQLDELAECGEALIMLGEAIRNQAKKRAMTAAKSALIAASIAAPALISETARNTEVSLPTPK